MATQRILSHLKAFPRLNRRNLMLSSWREGVKDLPVKNKMKFNVGGIQAESREGLLKFMETEEGKKKSALWFGWGGTITLGLGEIQFLIWGVMVMGYAFNMALYPWYFRILALSHILSGAGYPRVLPGEGQRKAEHQVNVLKRVWVRPADLQAQCHVQAESGSGTGGIWPTHFVWEVKYKGRFMVLRAHFTSELLDPVTNGSLSCSSGAIIGMPGYMVRDGDQDLSSLAIKTNYNRWFKGFKIPEDIR